MNKMLTSKPSMAMFSINLPHWSLLKTKMTGNNNLARVLFVDIQTYSSTTPITWTQSLTTKAQILCVSEDPVVRWRWRVS
ncbi:hypothetical protein E2C01_018621 [Portunus trituberculatus]|uniref:Uncharacterized protein n=1 Tax=Portunus trituberculatus TaxID=210409 RepID=A0A5B7DXK0_PORTR|nr:hypothetical protein [Portunus trituberculatus]